MRKAGFIRECSFCVEQLNSGLEEIQTCFMFEVFSTPRLLPKVACEAYDNVQNNYKIHVLTHVMVPLSFLYLIAHPLEHFEFISMRIFEADFLFK